jgi:predicted glycosyltransferase
MKVLIDIGHPAHVHFFKNIAWAMEKNGHEVLVTAREKDVTVELLESYGFKYEVLSRMGTGKGNLMKEWAGRDIKLLKIARKFNPDFLTGILNPCVAHVAWLMHKKSLIFTDTEHAKLANRATLPFADMVFTPTAYARDVGKKQVRYNGYHELAYLHPAYFHPDPDFLSSLNIDKDERIIVLRFVSWGASHDVGQHGVTNKLEMVREFEKHGKVFISSEQKLEPELDKYRIHVRPDKLHDLLYYASLYVGDGGTTAVESAILGTPSIYVSSLVGTMGNFTELEDKYGLMYSFNDSGQALRKGLEILGNKQAKQEWGIKKDQLIRDKIDVTGFVLAYLDLISSQART